MRLIVLFDLPVVRKIDKRNYSRFHKFLVRDGYDMIQYSIYARICNGPDAIDKHLIRLMQNVPREGSVRTLEITEKQFTAIKVLVGKKREKEDTKYSNQLSFF